MPFDGVETPLGYLAKLDQVIDLIQTPGKWVKHTYRTPSGRYCLKEVLNVVGVAELFEANILKAAEEVMEREFCCIESFNDHPLTMRGDVIAVLQRTRSNILAGKAALPKAGSLSLRWNDYRPPEGEGETRGWWSRLFCWN